MWNTVILTHICLPTQKHNSQQVVPEEFFITVIVTGEETTDVKNPKSVLCNIILLLFCLLFFEPLWRNTKLHGFSILSGWMNALVMLNYSVSWVENCSKKGQTKQKQNLKNTILTLTTFFSFGKPKTWQYFTLCVLSSGFERWSCFFSFLSQQALAPLKWPWAIASISSTTFL